MSVCAAIKPDGARCKARAMEGSQWCFNHHPDYSEERRRNATKGGKRGGRGRPQADLAALKDRLMALGEDVIEGNVDRSRAAVASQCWNTAIAAIRVGLKAKEIEDLEVRLSELEEALEANQGRYGA